MNMKRSWLGLLVVAVSALPAQAAPPRFERIVIDANFPGGYQVEVADVNGDKKPDIIALGGGTCVWYENPTWKRRTITGPAETPDIISSAAVDLDRDGKAEVAIAYDFEMNSPQRGKLALAIQGDSPGAAWSIRPIASVPSIHRIRWTDIEADGELDLVAAPIFGTGAKPPAYEGDATVRIFNRQRGPNGTSWDIAEGPALPVLHAIELVDLDRDGRHELLTASNRGINLHRMTARNALSVKQWKWDQTLLSAGAAGEAPARGSSEVHLGHLNDGRRLLASVEAWHGREVAVCLENLPGTLKFEPRQVIDDTLNDGHALWLADIDRDGDDEVFAGHRGANARVAVYDYDGIRWNRTIVDTEITPQDLRGGDIDGDGAPDVVAIGGASHNVVWYRPLP